MALTFDGRHQVALLLFVGRSEENIVGATAEVDLTSDRPNSMAMSALSSEVRFAPPYSSGVWSPHKPAVLAFPCKALTVARSGNRSPRISAFCTSGRRGRTSLSVNSRTVCKIIFSS